MGDNAWLAAMQNRKPKLRSLIHGIFKQLFILIFRMFFVDVILFSSLMAIEFHEISICFRTILTLSYDYFGFIFFRFQF